MRHAVYVGVFVLVVDGLRNGPHTCNVRTAGAKGDGFADDTAALAASIQGCRDGGLVVFPPGNYLSKPLQLASSIELHFQAGAQITAWRDLASWPNSTATNCSVTPYEDKDPVYVPQK
eukprot:gene6368-6158_t